MYPRKRIDYDLLTSRFDIYAADNGLWLSDVMYRPDTPAYRTSDRDIVTIRLLIIDALRNHALRDTAYTVLDGDKPDGSMLAIRIGVMPPKTVCVYINNYVT